jgi:hypothetical protein
VSEKEMGWFSLKFSFNGGMMIISLKKGEVYEKIFCIAFTAGSAFRRLRPESPGAC